MSTEVHANNDLMSRALRDAFYARRCVWSFRIVGWFQG
jgi:hypothetical protein